MLPKLDGISALYEIRKAKVKSKVIILSAKSEVEDKIIGLDGGADDYVTKPFNSQELLARIRAVTKRDSDLFDNHIYSFQTLKLNTKTFEISNKEKKIALTSKEFKILELLIVNRNQITSIDTILLKVWGYDEGDATSVWTYISYLRKKLQKLECNIQIKLIRNIGYILIEGDNHD